jgi:hypothetical protein
MTEFALLDFYFIFIIHLLLQHAYIFSTILFAIVISNFQREHELGLSDADLLPVLGLVYLVINMLCQRGPVTNYLFALTCPLSSS